MSGMEVVMALLFGHFDGEVQAAGILGGTMLQKWQLPDRGLEAEPVQ
jgi:hypothetical protein